MPGKYLIVHHTGGSNANPLADTSHHTFDMVDQYHKARWEGTTKSSLGYYIGYHYFIDKAGKVTQGRADTEWGAHTVGYNDSIGVCLAGNFDATDPTEAQKTALRRLLNEKMAQYSISLENLYPHRKFAAKTCYGRRLADNWLQKLMKITNIRVLVVSTFAHRKNLLYSRLAVVRDYWKTVSEGRLIIDFVVENKNIDTEEMIWTGNETSPMRTIQSRWLSLNVIPYASGYDACVLWMDNTDWKSQGSIAFSLPDQILGVHFIGMGVIENYQDSRWEGRYDNSMFCGVLAHELGHMLYQRTGGNEPLNNTGQHKPHYDNTHYFDFINPKKLDNILDEVYIEDFIGWKLEKGVRMFKLAPVSYKRKKFSGFVLDGKVYSSSDKRMFFKYLSGWHSITEDEYTQEVLTGSLHGVMAVEEANEIQYTLGLPFPPIKPKAILEKRATNSFEEATMGLLGWSRSIPQINP